MHHLNYMVAVHFGVEAYSREFACAAKACRWDMMTMAAMGPSPVLLRHFRGPWLSTAESNLNYDK